MPKRTTASRIEAFLRKDNWRFRKDPDDRGLFRMGFTVLSRPFELMIHDAARQKALLFLVTPIVFISESQRRDFAELLSKLNYGLLLGAYEMDPADGEVRLKLAVPTDKAAVTDQQIRHCIAALLNVLAHDYAEISDFVLREQRKKKSAR